MMHQGLISQDQKHQTSDVKHQNAFERHGIKHLSPSAINTFASSPAAFVLKYALKRHLPASAAMHRGTAVEHGLAAGLINPSLHANDCIEIAVTKYRQLMLLNVNPQKDRQEKVIAPMVRTALPELRRYGPITEANCQVRVEMDIGLPVPIIGYSDFIFPACGVLIDLKSTSTFPGGISTAHKRQVALYHFANGGRFNTRVGYLTSEKWAAYSLDREAATQGWEELGAGARAIAHFLAAGETAADLAAMTFPDRSSIYLQGAGTDVREFWGL